MPAYLTFADTDPTPLAAEAMGWQPLGPDAFLHRGDADGAQNVIHVVGVPDASLGGMNVLLI